MSRPARWALSPLDLQAHLLLDEGSHPKGVLKARSSVCAARTPTPQTVRQDTMPPVRKDISR